MALCRKGFKLRVLVRSDSNYYQRISDCFGMYGLNLGDFSSQIEFAEGDVTDIPSLEEAMEGIDCIMHSAAVVSFSKKHRDELLKTNIEGTGNLVNLALYHNIRWFMHTSSVATIGDQPAKECDESMFWKYHTSISDYAVSKYGAEQHVWRGIEEGLPAVIVNPSVIIGPSPEFRSSAAAFNSGVRTMGFYLPGRTGYVDVRDVVKAIIYLFENNIRGERFILNGENALLRDFQAHLAEAGLQSSPTRKAPVWLIKFFNLIGRITQNDKLNVPVPPPNRMFSSKKFQNLSGMKFLSLRDSVKYTVRALKGEIKWKDTGLEENVINETTVNTG